MGKNKALHILICTLARPQLGGVYTYIKGLSRALKEAGHDVDILTLFGISKQPLRKERFVLVTDRLIEGSNVRTMIAYLIAKLIMIFRLSLVLMHKKYSIIHANDFASCNCACLLSRLRSIPVIFTVHSSGYKDLINDKKITQKSFACKYIIAEEKRAFKRATLVIANSRYINHYVSSLSPSHARVIRSNNFVERTLFFNDYDLRKTERARMSLADDYFVVLCPGRLIKRKGVVYPLLTVKKLISNGHKEIRLIYVGDGPEKQDLQQLIRKHKLEKYVRIFGSLAHNEMNRFYNIADAVVVPSVKHKGLEEPIGIIPLEAMASRVPVIASKSGGLSDVVKNEITGLLVPEKDSDAIEDAILRLISDKVLRSTITENSIKQIERDYTDTVVAERMVGVYCSAIQRAVLR